MQDLFKDSIIIPVLKKPHITGLNDYRPITLTLVVMKSFNSQPHIHQGLPQGSLHFAYRANRSVGDALNMDLQFHPLASGLPNIQQQDFVF